jgi:hypothetical protein
MCTQIERDPRQGVELVLPHQPGAPASAVDFLRLVACDVLVAGLVFAAGLWWFS